MKLEQQVSNKELSVRLRDLGVKQESLFYWTRPPESDDIYVCWYWENMSTASGETVDWEQISAFTVAELGEMLPEGVTSSREFYGGTSEKCWFVEYDQIPGEERDDFKNRCFTDDTEADARAALLIYLIENNLLSV